MLLSQHLIVLSGLTGAGEEAPVVLAPALVAVGQVGDGSGDGPGRAPKAHEVVGAHGVLP